MLTEVAETLVRDGWHVVLPCRRYRPLAVPEQRTPGVAALKSLRPRGHLPNGGIPAGGPAGRAGAGGGGVDRFAGRGSTRALAGGFDRSAGRALWVEAEWTRPRDLAAKAGAALGGPADLVVAWVHEQYRRSVLGACEPLLAPLAPAVEVRTIGGPPEEPEPLLTAHPTQLVLVGTLSELHDNRPLSHTELTEAVLHAVTRAVEGRSASLHQVGQSRPLVH
ncbi:hypothetical protein FNH07_17085 [Amycolatopsis bartoniae]|nr:hypothetical protein FNH07_17085 [Amycolatopsis bartoniae]